QFVQSEHVSRSGSTAKTKSLIQYQYGIILNPGLDEYKTGTVWIWRSPESQRNRRNRAGSPESSIRQTLSEAEGEAYQCVSWSCLPIPCDCGDSARFRAISATLRTVNRSAHILTAARHSGRYNPKLNRCLPLASQPTFDSNQNPPRRPRGSKAPNQPA